MTLSAARAGLWPRSLAFIADIFALSMFVSLIGIGLAEVTGGSVRVGEAIGSRLYCTAGETMAMGLKLPPNTKPFRVQRCTKELLGVPYDRFLVLRARTHDADFSTIGVFTAPLNPMGDIADALYLDSLVFLLFGVYAFFTEWRFGATLGKRLLAIQVRPLAGAPIDALQAGKRAMVRMAAFAPATIATACTTGLPAFAWWLFEHPVYKIIGGVFTALWSAAFAANFVFATMRQGLPWHDRWAGTEAMMKRNDRPPHEIQDFVVQSSPPPPWLFREPDKYQRRSYDFATSVR